MDNRYAIKKTLVAAIILTAAQIASAQTAPSAASAKIKKEEIDAISSQLNNLGSDLRVESAVSGIEILASKNQFPPELGSVWLPALIKVHRDKEVSSLSLRALLSSPTSSNLKVYMTLHIQSLINLKEYDNALKSALSYYNCADSKQVDMEWSLGSCIIILPYAYARRVAMCLFTLFICIILSKLRSGAVDCGCFGEFRIPPQVTLIIDSTVVVLLVLVKFPRDTIHHWISVSRIIAVLMGTAVIVLLLLKGDLTYLMRFRPRNEVSRLLSSNDLPSIEYALLNEVDIGANFSHGSWLVAIHRTGCGLCNETLPRLANNYNRIQTEFHAGLAFVRIGDMGANSGMYFNEEILVGSFREPNAWFAATPTLAVLSDGKIQFVEAGENAADVDAVLSEWEMKTHSHR